ncbi:MAG: hypothetical protein LBG92_12635 [Prevotellaceae bacterium]|jgi:site-specific recombinase XerD|nr:hypothetical protein [Prevotellaceae bacterium]
MKQDKEKITAYFLQWLDTGGYSTVLMRYCRLSVKPFFKWLESKQIKDLNFLTDKHIADYHAFFKNRPNRIYKEQGLGVAHLNKTFIAIDKFLEFLHYYGIKTAPAPANYRILKPKKERTPQIEMLMNTSYKAIATEYAVWLDTLGYSKDVLRSCNYAVYYFFEWL